MAGLSIAPGDYNGRSTQGVIAECLAGRNVQDSLVEVGHKYMADTPS